MTTTIDRERVWSDRVLRLLVVLPPLVILFLIVRYAVNVPFHDEWGWSVKHVISNDLPKFRIGRFWALNNEHRVFIPKLLSTSLGHLTNLDMRAAIYTKLLITVSAGLVLSRMYWKSAAGRAHLAVPIVLSLCLCNLAQWPRWIDVRPLPSTLSILGLAGALHFLCSGEPSRRRFWAAAGCAWISSSSYFSGNITWAVALVALFLCNWSARARVGWFLLALAVGAQYLIDFTNTRTLTGASDAPPIFDVVHFAVVFIGSVCSATHRGLQDQTEALYYGLAGISTGAWLSWILCRRAEDGVRRAAPWIAILLWVILNALATGYGRISTAGLLGARAWRYTVFGGLFWAALGVLAVIVLLEHHQSIRERSRGIAFGTLALLFAGLLGGNVGMLQAGGLEAYSKSMRNGRASLLLGEYANPAHINYMVPSLMLFERRLPKLIKRKASFLYGEQVLTLPDSKRHELVKFGRKPLGRENRPYFTIDRAASVGWDLHIQDRPFVNVCFEMASTNPGMPARVSVRIITEKESTVVGQVETRASMTTREAKRIDLRAWIGQDVTLRFRCEPDSPSRAHILSPRLTYDVLDREPQ